MSLNNLKSQQPWLYVSIIEPTNQEKESYYDSENELRSSDTPRIFKKATILHTFDDDKYPKGSEWMMGESPGMKVNYFGKKYTIIQEKDLYKREG